MDEYISNLLKIKSKIKQTKLTVNHVSDKDALSMSNEYKT